MNSYVKYSMHGFNEKNPEDSTKWVVNLLHNQEKLYQNHPFLYSVYIDDTVTSITFTLKPGISCKDYMSEIHLELEKICYNLISRARELIIKLPYCLLDVAYDCEGNDCSTMEAWDYIHVQDELCFVRKEISADSMYDICLNNDVALKDREAAYKELFYILHNPHRVTQFIGLYDIMADLIYNSGINVGKRHVQEMVLTFFKKYADRYKGIVEIKESTVKDKKGVSKLMEEDSFSRIRNQIAHSKDRGIREFLEVAENISGGCIQNLLIIINDLLCGNVEP